MKKIDPREAGERRNDMSFKLPEYHHPDFSLPQFVSAPEVKWELVEKDGVAPEYFHSTSMYPEYFKIGGQWVLAEESRMDSSVVICEDGNLEVVENRNLKQGQKVILGRSEQCQEGIHVHNTGFETEETSEKEKFVFRQGRSRETSYARDYDNLLELLKYEKEHGNILWVMGPAFSFDHNARKAMQALVENGYAHGLMAGNALATHDLEGALLHTALGQDIYTQVSMPNGHYNHLDVINRVRRSGSIPQFIEDYKIDNGIIYSCVKKQVPFVLTGSIRDDGPMPEVIANLFTIMKAVSTPDTVEHFTGLWNRCEIRYGDLKKQLAEDIIKTVAPIRANIGDILADDAYLHKVASMGAERARASADRTVSQVREIMGITRF